MSPDKKQILFFRLLKTQFTIVCCFLFVSTFAQIPNGFVDEMISDEWNTPVGLTFDANGRMYVWEKNGKVFIVENGTKQENPLIDLSEEVLDFNDHGLNGFALDPNFLQNGYIYLMYATKRYFVENFGTDNFNKTTNAEEPFKTTIGRIVRYKANASDAFRSVDLGSRKVLIGENLSTGIPILVDNHGVGSLVFGTDGSLFASAGDAAFLTEPMQDDTESPWFQEAISVGIITAEQNIGAYRSQSIKSLNGKILRINPETGDGFSSNPFFDGNNPRSPQSRIWALGLRNPFRFSVKPNSGSKNVNEGNPGILLVGDVGWSHQEEINIVSKGGQNFDWPFSEGFSHQNTQFDNPDFLPKNPQKPVIDWRDGSARAMVNGEVYDVNTPQFQGNNFTGNSSIGGVWYPDDEHFPAEFRNTYFQGDFSDWVKCFRFDNSLTPKEVVDFASNVHPTCFAIHPKTGAIFYTNYSYPDIHEIRSISYSPNSNLKPTAVLSANKIYGTSPLEVQFSGSQSKDPEGEPLKFDWDFGDDSKSNETNPTHVYSIPFGEKMKFTTMLTVTDNIGQASTKTIQIFVGNAPPIIEKTTIDTLSQFDNANDFTVKLDAQVANSQNEKITYQWSVVLHHDDHTHFQTAVDNQKGQVILASVPCDEQKYFYRISLKVTDSLGLSSTIFRDIKPICKKIEVVILPSTTGKMMLFALKKNENVALLKWAVVIKNTGGFFYEIYRNGTLLRRIAQGTSFVEVSIDKTKTVSEYQIFAKDNGGNVVSSNVSMISAIKEFELFNFQQLSIFVEILIAQFETEWSKQMRVAQNDDCPEEMILITGNFMEKIAKTQIISDEVINQKTLFNAGKSIVLKAGFKVEKGEVFETKIEGCK